MGCWRMDYIVVIIPLGDLDLIHSLATTTFIDIYLFAKKELHNDLAPFHP